MAGFVFERDLPHQNAAVAGSIRALEGINIEPSLSGTKNPRFMFEGQSLELDKNLRAIKSDGEWKQDYKINTNDLSELIFDISMETGTGKTYAYTKTMLALNKQTGVTKFIVAVPRIAIKAGTVNFLKSKAVREHFKDEYDREIKVYEVQSQKGGKGKKEYMPQAIADFCRADSQMNKKVIHVLVINAQMVTSSTMEKAFDVALFDEINTPYKAIAGTKPILIIDEPHMFKRGNTTYKKLMRFKPQFTLRYGATFDDDLINMVYELTAVEAFNQDLVKGITVHLEEFEAGENIALRFIDSDGIQASFELNDNNKKTRKVIAKGDSFETIHPEMNDLKLEKLNRSTAILSNGLELKKGDRINPYSYSETLQEKMVRETIVTHFEIERQLMLGSPRIKALSLFFIDNIESYRDDDGALRIMFESFLEAHLKELIKHETNKSYKSHLQKALADISMLHGGYFSKDNSESDEKIEQETLEILHDKETLLNIDNPRRFIFSKWTLREGWDNPNVFCICKLRSSGSETSKLQEVGRGLRLPVNEFKSRDKSGAHELHYFVDFTEKKFTEKLTNEINEKSGASLDEVNLSDNFKALLVKHYSEFKNENDIIKKLVELEIIDYVQNFESGGFEKLKENYPKIFEDRLKKNKIKNAGTKTSKASIRLAKYQEFKELWEALNEKVVLEYKIETENEFEAFFYVFMKKIQSNFLQEGSTTKVQKLQVHNSIASFETTESLQAKILPFVVMDYKSFLRDVCDKTALSIHTVHNVFMKLKKDGFKIEQYMNQATIRKIRSEFNHYLMEQVFGKFEIGFKQTTKSVHPTKFTDIDGSALDTIPSSDLGVMFEEGKTPDSYLFNEIFFDGDLEKKNINTNIKEIIVYSKIPKNSIRIPLAGGGTYSPDFAYVIKDNEGNTKLNLIIETKGKDEIDLGKREEQKIKHAENFYNFKNSTTKVIFETQLKTDNIKDIIQKAMA